MTAQIAGRNFRIEFSYRRRDRGVSACAIVADDDPRIVALGIAVRGPEDQWSKRQGRKLAFQKAVNECGPLRGERLAFFAWFLTRFPEPRNPPRAPKWPLSPEEIERRIAQGRAAKALRRRLAALIGAGLRAPSND